TTSERIDGAVLSVIGAMTVAVYLVIGRRLRSSLALTPYIWSVYGIAAVIVLAGVTITSTSITGHSAGGYLWVIATGLVPQLIGHSSLNYALAFLPATYVSISTQMEPILSAIAAVIVFAEIPGALQIVGGTFIITGVIVATVSQSRASRKPRQMQVNA
ncbi:MAG: DMT family transporter, partial [Chloroflexota bacterium]